MQTWIDRHPDWHYTLYGNEYLASHNFQTKPQMEEYLRRGWYAGVADLLRYEILYREGGFLAEADSLCLHPIDELLGDGSADRPWTLVANLPYNVATPLVLRLLEQVPAITSMLVMVQREVAERLAAAPGDPAYGIPSVKVAYRADAEVVGRVPPTVFVPRPRVESALVRLRRLPAPRVATDPDRLFRLVEAAFGQRRKMLRQSLKSLGGEALLARAGIDGTRRAETLSVEEFVRLAHAV